ncbi:hypothetical protein F2Q70_00015778 [Brassica cretica]|uniref:Uncharacterized protein n=1 Tax=Brassica cretica TaxID=69181 RepID=A0A8S9I085_BRACR|nr:hypothetical protein F2Q70_00015778 [Brassica cretica]
MRPQMRTASMPPGTTTASAQPTRPPGVVGSSTSSAAPPPPPPPTYERRTEEALLRAPSRINQPHLHPDKINGALWIEVDPEVHEFIKATWQGNYWGPWQSWQQYYWEEIFHEETYFKWKLRTQVTICGRISQKRQKNKEPSYISVTDWETILANWSTPEAKAKSQSASVSRCSAPPGLKMHVHVDEGFEEPVSYPDLVRKTHTRKDGTFIDERAEALVLEVKQAVEEMLQEGSPGGDSQTDSTAATTTSKRLLLNQEYTRSTIYGLGNLQYKNKRPSESVPAALKRDIDIEMRISGLESLTQEIKFDFHSLKTDFNEGTARITQPQGQAQPEGHGQAPSPPHDQPQAPGDAQPHLITDNHSALDRWCNAELGLKMHVHGAGPRTFANIAYKMGPVSYPDLVRKTHTRKDGTFIDERAEALVLEVEQAVEEMLQEGSPGVDSQTDSTAGTTTSKRLLLTQEYIKRGETRRGTIYRLGNLQYKNKCPSESVPAALKRDIDIEMRVSGLETLTQKIKSDVHDLKSDFNEGTARTQSTLNMILQLLQPQAFNAQPSQSQHHSPSHSEAQPQGQA